MQITDVKIRKKFDDDKPLKAVASVTFDGEFVLHEVKLVYAGGRFITVMPGRKLPDGSFRDVAHPITKEFRSQLQDAIVQAYEEAPVTPLYNADESAEPSFEPAEALF